MKKPVRFVELERLWELSSVNLLTQTYWKGQICSESLLESSWGFVWIEPRCALSSNKCSCNWKLKSTDRTYGSSGTTRDTQKLMSTPAIYALTKCVQHSEKTSFFAQDFFYISYSRSSLVDWSWGYNVYQIKINSGWILCPSFSSQRKSSWPKQNLLSAQHVKNKMPVPVKELKCQIDMLCFSNFIRLLRVRANKLRIQRIQNVASTIYKKLQLHYKKCRTSKK